MIRETIVPAIPDLRGDNLKDVVTALKSTLDVREGRVGDPLDQAVTLRDLTDLHLPLSGGPTSTASGGPLPGLAILPPAVSGYKPPTDLTPPPPHTSLPATGGHTTRSRVPLSPWGGGATFGGAKSTFRGGGTKATREKKCSGAGGAGGGGVSG